LLRRRALHLIGSFRTGLPVSATPRSPPPAIGGTPLAHPGRRLGEGTMWTSTTGISGIGAAGTGRVGLHHVAPVEVISP
jgi:hypothetical protein